MKIINELDLFSYKRLQEGRRRAVSDAAYETVSMDQIDNEFQELMNDATEEATGVNREPLDITAGVLFFGVK